jgi:hypothetical protein
VSPAKPSVTEAERRNPVPQPSTTATRVLLDASSLIDLEHERPISFPDLGKKLREHNAQLVLTRTNILEFSASAEETGNFSAVREMLLQIEQLPVTYLREGGITFSELKEAVRAFSEHREFRTIAPQLYVRRWDETLVLEGSSPAEILVNQRLDELVDMLWKQGALRLTERRWGKRLQRQFEEDRRLAPSVRKAIRRNFPMVLKRHLDQFSIQFDEKQTEQLAEWIYDDPSRCPGHRLSYDVRQELMNDLRKTVTGNDISDFAHVAAVPYVDVITMDHTTADLCRRVSRRLRRNQPTIRYEERIFSGLQALLDAKTGPFVRRPA